MKSCAFLLFFGIVSALSAQSPVLQVEPARIAAERITADAISRHLHILASDEFEGRETGTPGNDKAAAYIADQFKSEGIPPVPALNGYYQSVRFSNVQMTDVQFVMRGVPYGYLKDYIIPVETMPSPQINFKSDEVIFLGYGIDDPAYSDYAKENVAGKAILIYKGEPVSEEGKSWITGKDKLSKWSDGISEKLRVAREKGVAMVYVIEDDFRSIARKERMFFLGGEMVMGEKAYEDPGFAPYVLLSSATSSSMLGKKSDKVIRTRDKIKDKGKPKCVKLKVDTEVSATREVNVLPGQNVLGFIEGTDPDLKDQLIVVSAHYDHLGKRGDEIYHGADDNGSGSSAVITISDAFATAKKQGFGPRRSVLCILMTGEEKGLLGSEYYSEFPVFPLANTVADVNIDMIGRMDDKHDDPAYTYVIGADRLSSDLHAINEEMNEKYTHLELDYTYNAESDPNRFYYRSDHYNFAKNGIPAIFFFSGVHEDYHRPTDTVDKIMFDKAAVIAKLAFFTAWELANRDERIVVDKRS